MWVDQIKDDLCLWHHHVNYHDKKNVGAHQVGGRNTETTDIKRYLLDIMLVVLIETRKKRMWINDCKYKTKTEWVDVYWYCIINIAIIATTNIQFEDWNELMMCRVLHTPIDKICALLLDLITLLMLCYFVV